MHHSIHQLKTHQIEKEHKCPHCPYQTAEKYVMNRHIRTHTKEKPYVCDICNFK